MYTSLASYKLVADSYQIRIDVSLGQDERGLSFGDLDLIFEISDGTGICFSFENTSFILAVCVLIL